MKRSQCAVGALALSVALPFTATPAHALGLQGADGGTNDGPWEPEHNPGAQGVMHVELLDGLVSELAATSPTNADLATATPLEKAESILRCFDLDELTYCLGYGFVDEVPDYVTAAASMTRAVSDGPAPGAMDVADFIDHRVDLSSANRLNEERLEIEQAVAGIDKARAVAAVVAGKMPEFGNMDGIDRGEVVTMAFPWANAIMNGYQTEQERSYWCGPATFQSIDWADDGGKDTQADWASSDDLGTTTSGTAITKMVSHTNLKTNWDIAAGAYIVQSVSSWSTASFFNVHQSHLGDGTPAPIIEHPKLLDEYFDYLAKDHSGHYQVGRGYDSKTGSVSTWSINIFEVFDERDWSTPGNHTSGTQMVLASKLLAATKANSSFKNIGL